MAAEAGLGPTGMCVIFNPNAGRRRAERRLSRYRQKWESQATFWPTTHAAHAGELARQALEQGARVVAAAGGDGTVHEVANGLLSADRDAPPATLAIVPVGSANDYAWSVTRQCGLSDLDDDCGNWVDIGIVETPSGKRQYFVESIGLGLSAQVTAESRKPSRTQGVWLYGLAALRVLSRSLDPDVLELHWDDEPGVRESTLLLSLMLGVREGGFRMAPQARLDDGLFDVVQAGEICRWRAITLMPRLALCGPPQHDPQIHLRSCRRLKVISARPLTIHTDGELFSTSADAIHEVQIQLLPSRLRVKVCRL